MAKSKAGVDTKLDKQSNAQPFSPRMIMEEDYILI